MENIPNKEDAELQERRLVLEARNRAQMEEAFLPHHLGEARVALGPNATDAEIMLYFARRYGEGFAEDWNKIASDDNRYFAGESLKRSPTLIEAYRHYRDRVPDSEQCHHRQARA
jgi:hypothetical protein